MKGPINLVNQSQMSNNEHTSYQNEENLPIKFENCQNLESLPDENPAVERAGEHL